MGLETRVSGRGSPGSAAGLGKIVLALIVWGSEDRITPLSDADLLIERLSDAQKLVLDGASHPCYLDLPDQFHQALLEFLKRVY